MTECPFLGIQESLIFVIRAVFDQVISIRATYDLRISLEVSIFCFTPSSTFLLFPT